MIAFTRPNISHPAVVLLLIQTRYPLAPCLRWEEIGFYHGPVPPGPSATSDATVNRAVTLICGPQGDPTHYKTSKTPTGMHSSPSSDFCLVLTMSSLLSSPAKHTRNSAGTFSAVGNPPVRKLCEDMDNEMRHDFVGPMPVKLFFQKFLPAQPLSKKDKASLPGFEDVAKRGKETVMYGKLVRRFPHSIYFPFPILFLVRSRS